MKGKILREESCFPERLKESVCNCKHIYYSGNRELLGMKCIAVVGSRICTDYGKTVARAIGKRVSECGGVVVSGLANGIDQAAHTGALEGGGRTIAVLGNGLDVYYPASNRALQKRIEKEGLLISEYEEGFKPRRYTFPARNRIICGVSEAVVVVEAKDNSGALITAELAAEQGKKLYAVPGNITSYYSFGTNKLIRENVTPLIFIDDLLVDMGIPLPLSDPQLKGLGDDEMRIYEVISRKGELSIEDIQLATNMRPQEISGIITILEMKGLIFSSMGRFFAGNFKEKR